MCPLDWELWHVHSCTGVSLRVGITLVLCHWTPGPSQWPVCEMALRTCGMDGYVQQSYKVGKCIPIADDKTDFSERARDLLSIPQSIGEEPILETETD